MKFVSKDNLNSFSAKIKTWVKNRKIKATDLDSGGATQGQVATADGQGGVSYQTPSTGMSNPMTTAGDIIVGGVSGEASRLAKGTDGKVLKMVSGSPAWGDDAEGMANPMTTAGDIIIGGSSGTPTRLAKGTNGKVLKMVSGSPAWADESGGMSNPMTTIGDLIVSSDNSGTPSRLAKGTAGQILAVNSGATGLEWKADTSISVVDWS